MSIYIGVLYRGEKAIIFTEKEQYSFESKGDTHGDLFKYTNYVQLNISLAEAREKTELLAKAYPLFKSQSGLCAGDTHEQFEISK